jgi:hypothetical protein
MASSPPGQFASRRRLLHVICALLVQSQLQCHACETLRTMDAPSLAHITERIDFHTKELVSWKRLLNARAAINRLPHEVLASIFPLQLPPTWMRDPGATSQRFMEMTHVCAHWRTVALETPSLWTILPCPSDQQTNEALRRAGNHVPLHITMNRLSTSKWLSARLFPDLLDVMRLGSLDIHLSPQELHACGTLLVQDAPQLSLLRIRVGDVYDDLGNRAFIPPTLPITERAAPWLRELQLFGCVSFAKSLRMPRLQSLHLIGRASTLDLDDFIHVLQHTPELHTLLFKRIFPRAGGTYTLRGLAPIELPCLRILKIGELTDQLVCFLKHLHCPVLSHLHLRLTTTSEMDNLRHIPFLIEYLARWSGTLSHVSVNERHRFINICCTPANSDSAWRAAEDRNWLAITISQNHNGLRQDGMIVATTVMQLLSHLHIETLSLSSLRQPILTKEAWLAYLHLSSASLREVDVSRDTACNLASALGVRVGGPSDPFFLNDLVVLKISDVWEVTVLSPALKTSLDRRSSAGLTGLTITISGCIISEQDIHAIRAYECVRELEYLTDHVDPDNSWELWDSDDSADVVDSVQVEEFY